MEVIKYSHGNSAMPHASKGSPREKTEQDNVMTTTAACTACKKSCRAIAFVLCAHYVTCLLCGHGMTECPMCRSQIMACVKIYE
jgi:hypothetical protein